MALNTFGGGPADITTDSSGNVVGGIQLKAYTAPNGGQRVTALFDTEGEPLPGAVVSSVEGDDIGRVLFQASDSYDQLFLDSGKGPRWVVPSREVFSATSIALSKASEALDVSEDAYEKSDTALRSATDALSKVGKYADLDIMKNDYQYVTQLRTPPHHVVQSFGKNLITGDYYGAQTWDIDDSGKSSTVIYRISPAGEVISKSSLMWAGHGSSIDVEAVGDDTYIWTWWSQARNGTPSGSRLVRWKYEPDVEVDLEDPSVTLISNVDGDTYTTVGIDQHNDLIAMRIPRGGASGSVVDFYLRKLSDVVDGRSNLLASVVGVAAGEAGAYQGHTTLGDYLYLAQGGVGGHPSTITRYHWYSDQVDVLDVSDAASNSLGEYPGGHAEIEKVTAWHTKDGRQVLLFGMATGNGGYRQSLIYGFTPVGSPDTGGDVIRDLSESTQSGQIFVTPISDEVMTIPVVFDWEFPGTPTVVVSPDSEARYVLKVGGVGSGKVTPQGFNVYFLRGNDTGTSVSWIAYYGPGRNKVRTVLP